MTEVLDGARKEIEDRLDQLHHEIKRLEAAAAALTDRAVAPRQRARRRASAGTGRTVGSGTRRSGSGQRAAQAERLVRENPGITIPELAQRMSIQSNYLYRVMPQLQRNKKVRKRGRGWHPA